LSLSEKVQAIEEVFLLLDQEMSRFQGWSGLSCKTGCGKCCNKADIEATVLEFIPFAHYVYHLNQYSEWLLKLQDHPDPFCLFFEPTKAGAGFCNQYPYRGLICRLFGFSARTDKYAKREFITCQVIKTEQAAGYAETVKLIGNGGFVPVMNQYYMRLHAIDAELTQVFYPINEAIRRAIHTVLHYYAYRN
jgi:Fe-S-cluster containining protein